ncbi:hypothetical protein F2Q69_00016005 [Brassica cretica]|uniref:Uncharacterized protein n=1 Tax=Brassica cretica TaxID=69181 RepID=A0A8S9QSF7_BRACR|nr:hypothetical protein F2Q69_00016005 [Brassica cretica]
MGQTSKAYPSYSDILRALLGGENFATATESGEHGGETLDPKASSEHLCFRYNKDALFASNPDSCAELVRRIRSGTHLMPEVFEFAFLEGFRESARADIEVNSWFAEHVLFCIGKVSIYATDRHSFSTYVDQDVFRSHRGKTVIETKDAEIAKLKKDALDKARGMVAERSRYYRERRQATETAAGLEEELENARSKVAQLEAEKLMKLGERRGRSIALGTLESMGMLEELGMHIPKKLKDALASNEAMFKKEMEEVTVESITEQDFVLPRFHGLDALQVSEHLVTASSSSSDDRSKHTTSGDHAGKPLGSALRFSTQETLIEGREPPLTDSKGMEVAGVTGTAASRPVAED